MNKEQDPNSHRNQFYKRFEDNFRGSRASVIDKLTVYLDFIEPLKLQRSQLCAVDLGCGRGEWLELLTNNGVAAEGVDLDKGMLEACSQRGFKATHGDAVEFLKSKPSDSIDLISGFHLVEHLEFEVLQALLDEAFRVLKFGGILIFETPNAENLIVGANNFYTDPTHKRPIPSHLLNFLMMDRGFYKSKVIRLQESEQLKNAIGACLMEVLAGVSPDYATIALKGSDSDFPEHLLEKLDREYGLSLDMLANRYDQQARLYLNGIQVRVDQVEENQRRVEESLNRLSIEYTKIIHSRSWRLTSPLRTCVGFFRTIKAKFLN